MRDDRGELKGVVPLYLHMRRPAAEPLAQGTVGGGVLPGRAALALASLWGPASLDD